VKTGLQGLDKVMANLNKQIAGINDRSMSGLFEAGLKIQRAAQQELRASVVTGNLRGSAYTRRSGQFVRLDDSKLDRSKSAPDPSGQVDGVEIGFTAKYALFAHENIEGNRAPKFLERPLNRNRKQIVEIIKKAAQMK